MKALIAKGLSIVQNDGIKVFTSRTWKYTLVKFKRLSSSKNVQNIEKWKLLKNKYKGERIFVIGNGPSLNQMPLYLLENEYTIGFNRVNLLFERSNWVPNFYMVTDDLVIKDMYEQINEEILPIVDYAFFPDLHPSNVDFTKYIDDRKNVYWLNTDNPEFSEDLPNCGINKTVVNGALQVAAYLGFKEIYLLGVDMTFADQKVKKINSRNWEADDHDPNHFDPRYFGKGRKYHNPTVHEMLEKFNDGKEFFEKRDISIHNAGFGGKLEIFPRVQFESLFDLSETEIKNLLNSSKVLTERGLCMDDMLSAPLIENETNAYPSYFRTSNKLGVALIPKVILSYLPVGPFKEQFFFVKR